MSQFDLNLAVKEYGTLVEMLVQQRGSKLRGTVMESGERGEGAAPVNQIAPTKARKVLDRYGTINFEEVLNDRRWVFPEDYDWAAAIDNFDKLRLLVDLQGPYVEAAAMAMGRSIDEQLLAAMFGTAKTGKDGNTLVAFPTTQVVAATKGASSDTGLNVAKLKHARKILKSNNVDLDFEPVYCAITAQQEEDLLDDIQVVSGDFNSARVLENGRLQSYLGINFIHTELVPRSENGYREIPIWVKSGMHLGVWENPVVKVTPRDDLRSQPMQVYYKMTLGATRRQEKKVVKVLCAE